jgi:transposase InsO family protein
VVKSATGLKSLDSLFESVQGIKQVLSAPRSPWRRAYLERAIGTIRRECLDHLIALNEQRLHRDFQEF